MVMPSKIRQMGGDVRFGNVYLNTAAMPVPPPRQIPAPTLHFTNQDEVLGRADKRSPIMPMVKDRRYLV